MSRLLAAAYALLAFAWIFTQAPGAGPDEPANYIKAIGVGRGQWIGGPGQLPAEVAAASDLRGARFDAAQGSTRWVTVPAGLAPDGFACNAFKGAVSSACVNQASPSRATSMATYEGTYQPFVYALPGLAARLAGSAGAALLLMRLVLWAGCVALLATAIWLLSDRAHGALPWLGLLIVMTPETVWLMSIVNASGPEVCAGLCLLAAALRMRRPAPVPTGLWPAVMVSAAVLALSRPVGVVWLVIDIALVAMIVGPGRLVAHLRAGGWMSRAAVGVAVAATGLAIGWELSFNPHHQTTFAEVRASLGFALLWLPENVREGIGVFGWLDTYMPVAAYLLWLLTFAVLMVVAWVLATLGDRLRLILLEFAGFAVTLALAALVLGPTGFAVQTRHVMAVGIAFPLFVGEVIYRNGNRLGPKVTSALTLAVGVVMAALQFAAWFVEARRQAVGVNGPLTFWSSAQWSPPLGWLPWFLAVGAGCVCLVAAILRENVQRRLQLDVPVLEAA